MNDHLMREALTEFERLVDLDADERATALARLASRDGDLARVQALLDQDGAPSPWLHEGQSHEALLRGIDDDSHRAGEQLGPFVLLRRLGRGGMGEVWEAQRADGEFAQRVALKILYGLALSPSARQRFLRERQVLARLEHPGIARLIDGGIEPSGIAWLALEFVDGEAIVAHVRRLRVPRAQRVQLLESVCDSVAFAHRQFVLHQDIKPANVLVDREGRMRLLDFGIARLLDADGDHASTGPSPRTPRYAPPELVRGEATGIAADVYQLGLLLGEVLDDADASANRRRAVDADLAAILAKATADDPRERHASAADLADDLARWRNRLRCRRGRRTGPIAASASSRAIVSPARSAHSPWWRSSADWPRPGATRCARKPRARLPKPRLRKRSRKRPPRAASATC
jgi:serine/threonine-protein kinase